MPDFFKTITPVENYTYQSMTRDLCLLEREFPALLKIDSIGKSEEGRELVCAVLGSPNAPKKIFINASIHAREHMTTTIAAAQIEYLLRTGERDILKGVCFHIVPMANPDGVFISQTGKLPKAFEKEYTYGHAKRWKANACGIDLNANFDGDWLSHGDASVTHPAPEGFKGISPECAKESRALAEHIRKTGFDMTLSYHTTGSEIYYKFGNSKTSEVCRSLALEISKVTGFELRVQSPYSSAGFKDWAIAKMSIPSLTIEFGRLSAPHSLCEFPDMWQSAKHIPSAAALWLEKT